jgi:hypothetical protein
VTLRSAGQRAYFSRGFAIEGFIGQPPGAGILAVFAWTPVAGEVDFSRFLMLPSFFPGLAVFEVIERPPKLVSKEICARETLVTVKHHCDKSLDARSQYNPT